MCPNYLAAIKRNKKSIKYMVEFFVKHHVVCEHVTERHPFQLALTTK